MPQAPRKPYVIERRSKQQDAPRRLSWLTMAQIHEMTSIDPWFLEQVREVLDLEQSMQGGTLAAATQLGLL